MISLKSTLIIGFVFVSSLGTLAHFFYNWSGQNTLVGFVTSVNESVWEHMKLIFFPSLLYTPIAAYFLKDEYPDIKSALACGIIAGTLFIPIFYYTYTGILGFDVTTLDIASFFIAVAITFLTTYLLAVNTDTASTCNITDTSFLYTTFCSICSILIGVFAFFFVIFTYNPPKLGIFRPPV